MATGSNPWPRRSLAGWLGLIAGGLLAAAQGVAQAQSDAPGTLRLEVRAGDTLIGIGQRYLDAPQRWRAVQRLNRIRDPRQLRPGTALQVPVDWLRWSALSAEVVHVTGTVTGPAGPLQAGMRLGAGDRFDTGAQGSVTLRFSDGALAVFAPQTRAGLAVSREIPALGVRATTIELQSGAVDTTATPLQAPASRFDVRTPRVVTAVRGTRFRVALQDDVSRHEVLEGRVALAGAAPAPLAVAQGEGVRAEAGRLGSVVPLLAAPDVSGIPLRIERTATPLQVPPQPGAVAWRWQVAADSAFSRLLQDVRTTGPVWVFTDLPDGAYHLRVRAADAQSLEGREAATALTLAARPEPPLQIAPPGGARVAAGVQLVWADLSGVPRYHLQVARDAGFRDLVLDRADITGSRFSPEPAWSPGTYHWRLASLRPDGSRGPFGDPGSFTVLEPSALAAPEVGGDTLRLQWSGPAGFQHQIQMARDAQFTDLLVDQVVDGASLALAPPAPGSYQVRTRLVLPDGSRGAWSAVQRFDIAPPPPPPPPPLPRHPWGLFLILLLPLLL